MVLLASSLLPLILFGLMGSNPIVGLSRIVKVDSSTNISPLPTRTLDSPNYQCISLCVHILDKVLSKGEYIAFIVLSSMGTSTHVYKLSSPYIITL